MATKTLQDLLTPEQIEKLLNGSLNFQDIKIESPPSSSHTKEELLSWLDKVSEGTTPEVSVPEFWLVMQYLCKINYQDGNFSVEQELPAFQEQLEACEAQHTTSDMLYILVDTIRHHKAFLKKCTASSIITRGRKKNEAPPIDETDAPF
jgi:hypothetical protein